MGRHPVAALQLHIDTNSNQYTNSTQYTNFERNIHGNHKMWSVICLTTEEKARKNLS